MIDIGALKPAICLVNIYDSTVKVKIVKLVKEIKMKNYLKRNKLEISYILIYVMMLILVINNF